MQKLSSVILKTVNEMLIKDIEHFITHHYFIEMKYRF